MKKWDWQHWFLIALMVAQGGVGAYNAGTGQNLTVGGIAIFGALATLLAFLKAPPGSGTASGGGTTAPTGAN